MSWNNFVAVVCLAVEMCSGKVWYKNALPGAGGSKVVDDTDWLAQQDWITATRG